MVEIDSYRNEYRISQKSIIELAGVKPYVVKQLAQKLVTQRLILQPYEANTDSFHTEAAFIELSKYLKISAEDYEKIISAFHYAQESKT